MEKLLKTFETQGDKVQNSFPVLSVGHYSFLDI